MNKLDDAVQKIKDFAVLSAILITGLALPFIGNILASIQIGVFPLYLSGTGAENNINSYLWLIFVMEAYGLVAVVLSIVCYKWFAVLKQCRYIPICTVFLFLIFFHYVVTLALHEDPFGWLIVGAYSYFIPVFWLISFFIFWLVFICAFLIAGFTGIIDRNCSEMSLSSENPHNENEDSEHETTKQ